MNWYLQTGNQSDVVISTRIRLARNIAGFNFEEKLSKEDSNLVIQKIEENLPSIGYNLKLLKLNDMDDITKMCLVEKHLVSPDFVLSSKNQKAILINEEENICIMINEEDHLRIQIFSAGLNLENSMNLAIEIDEKIGKLLGYSFNEKYGFLTVCPTNVGTGLRASTMVHLPALTKTGNIEKILDVINNFGMNIRGVYGEGSNVQEDVYQISNKQSLGISEKEIIKNLNIITIKIVEQEKAARKILEKNQIDLEDSLYRSFGILSNCKKISSKECLKLLSDVRLGTTLGIIDNMNDLKINKLELYTKPSNLQKFVGERLDEYQRDIKRAEVIKQIINDK